MAESANNRREKQREGKRDRELHQCARFLWFEGVHGIINLRILPVSRHSPPQARINSACFSIRSIRSANSWHEKPFGCLQIVVSTPPLVSVKTCVSSLSRTRTCRTPNGVWIGCKMCSLLDGRRLPPMFRDFVFMFCFRWGSTPQRTRFWPNTLNGRSLVSEKERAVKRHAVSPSKANAVVAHCVNNEPLVKLVFYDLVCFGVGVHCLAIFNGGFDGGEVGKNVHSGCFHPSASRSTRSSRAFSARSASLRTCARWLSISCRLANLDGRISRWSREASK